MTPARGKILIVLGSAATLTLPFLAALPASLGVSGPSTAPPAGGAEIGQVIGVTLAAIAVTAGLLTVGIGHRTRRLGLLAWGGGIAERVSGLPGWAALPAALAAPSLVTAVVGMYWDISLHIDVGRDPGPLANPSHYFILVGLFGIFSAGFLAIVMPFGKPGPAALRISGDWYAPLGGILIMACGAFSLVGFPLDDVWHRLFGQDVTLWGPTHLMLLGGAATSLVGVAVLMVEGSRAAASEGKGGEPTWLLQVRRVALAGALLTALSIFQAEFDFGVPQFRFVFQPMLVMFAAGLGLVATRIWLGRGAALGAVGFFLLIRGMLALLVGPVLGEATPHFPLYMAEAFLVELIALRVPRERPLALGLWCGVAIGSVGLAAEWGWSHVWMPLPWPSELLPEAALLGFPMAIASALLGAWLGARLVAHEVPRTKPLRIAASVAGLAVVAMVGYGLYKPANAGVEATVRLSEVQPAPQREVLATVQLDPSDAADGAEWLTATAWQGGGLVVDRLERVSPGVYRSTEPLPVYASWKALIRLHVGDSLTAVPVYLPQDRAIPSPKVPARSTFTRDFVADHEILQREQKSANAALWAVAYGVVLAITVSILTLIVWALHRLARSVESPPGPRRRAAAQMAPPGPQPVTG